MEGRKVKTKKTLKGGWPGPGNAREALDESGRGGVFLGVRTCYCGGGLDQKSRLATTSWPSSSS